MKNLVKIYHGSPCVVAKPELARGKANNDYGRGFYCTYDVEMAREWACKGKEPPAYVNEYELDLSRLDVLDISKSPYTVLNWIAVLLANRTFELDLEVANSVREYFLSNFMPPIAKADVVVGYRADDSYFSYAETFVENGLSVARLNEALRLGKLGTQIALRSEKAFSQLAFKAAPEVDWNEYHSRYVARDVAARDEWRSIVRKRTPDEGDVFAYDIVRGGWKDGDSRLRELLPSEG